MGESLTDKRARRAALQRSEAPPTQTAPSLAMAFSATALRTWGLNVSSFDSAFQRGMREDAAALGDVMAPNSTRPADWTFNATADDRVDVLLIGGHPERAELERVVERWLGHLTAHLTPVLIEYGRRRPSDKEFFGFNDGVSQPAMRGLTPEGQHISRRLISPEDPRSTFYAKPGQLLIWPGAFLFGYPGQTTVLTEPGVPVPPPTDWMQNGSYLVLRRLRQNVRAFREAVAALEEQLVAKGEVVPEGWAAARLVGRWPDGTPLTASPNHADETISKSTLRPNNFRFASSFPPTPLTDPEDGVTILPAVPSDPIGMSCPRVSHIRKVNPRDGTSEIGAEHHPGKLMLRRGITFGPEEVDQPEADRGLLFLSYQTSIIDQFRFVQINWANSSERPTGEGRDPIIGQDGTTSPQRQVRFFAPSRRQVSCPVNGQWVVATGGEYFVTPGVAGLRHVLGVEETG